MSDSKRPAHSPKEYLRAQRPERFSDSIIDPEALLDRSLLEYHLSTLTNRGQEKDFETFARKLAEKEICPNLLPQTGPTGGGDSKVDSETVPVATQLTLSWYVGDEKAAKERWAFAISAKKDWRSKVKDDVAKIAGTKRGYSKAFFITSQYVPDRVRAEVEDELRPAHAIDVRILDLTWILDRVFSAKHEQLAIAELGLKVTGTQPPVRLGPRDIQRQRDLDSSEKMIADLTTQGRLDLTLVDEAIRAAVLSRSLERPRSETDGRFLRAARLAEKHGTKHQLLRAAYEHAWATYFWFEDAAAFSTIYTSVEMLAIGTENAVDLELLGNLWFLLNGAAGMGLIDAGAAQGNARAAVLVTELDRLGAAEGRPSTALECETLRIFVELAQHPERAGSSLTKLRGVVTRSVGLVGFSLMRLADVLGQFGDTFGGLTEYDRLHEQMVEVTGQRAGEVTAARMLLKRGAQQLGADTPYDAIRSFGRALFRLHKHESRHDLVRALYLSASAYEKVGLLWAARGVALNAASLAADDFHKHSVVSDIQVACYWRMKWLELRLGRLPHGLAWHDLHIVARDAQASINAPSTDDEDIAFDCAVGQLFLNASIDQLKDLTKLPAVLDRLGLFQSRVALAYAMGDEDYVREGFSPNERLADTVRAFFVQWRDAHHEETRQRPLWLGDTRTVNLSSTILGCKVLVHSENNPKCLRVSETLLSMLESLLSTALHAGVITREPELPVRVKAAAFDATPLSFSLEERAGRPHLDVRCGQLDVGRLSQDDQIAVSSCLFDLAATVLGRVCLVPNIEENLEDLIGRERALERAIGLTGSLVTLANVLGDSPKLESAAWQVGEVDEPHCLSRRERWDAEDLTNRPQPDAMTPPSRSPAPSTREPPPDLSLATARHDNMEVLSIISDALWEKAGWLATAFLTHTDEASPPALVLVFENEEPARQLMKAIHGRIGDNDDDDKLRISIVRRIHRENPHRYRVVLGANPLAAQGKDGSLVVASMRVTTLNPSDSANLERFLASYGRHKCYGVVRGALQGGQVVPSFADAIGKHDMHVKDAWEVGRNDIEAAGILPDDEPIVPEAVKNPPVEGVLARKRRALTK